MKLPVLAGTLFGLVSVLGYLAMAAAAKRKPSLGDAVLVVIGAFSIPGALKMVCFVFTDQFHTLAHSNTEQSAFALGEEDVVFLIIGAMALLWVSVQTIIDAFSKLGE
jgi:hypothetical protein